MRTQYVAATTLPKGKMIACVFRRNAMLHWAFRVLKESDVRQRNLVRGLTRR